MSDIWLLYLLVGALYLLVIRLGRIGRKDGIGMFIALLVFDIVSAVILWLPFSMWSLYSTTQSETVKNRKGKGI